MKDYQAFFTTKFITGSLQTFNVTTVLSVPMGGNESYQIFLNRAANNNVIGFKIQQQYYGVAPFLCNVGTTPNLP